MTKVQLSKHQPQLCFSLEERMILGSFLQFYLTLRNLLKWFRPRYFKVSQLCFCECVRESL